MSFSIVIYLEYVLFQQGHCLDLQQNNDQNDYYLMKNRYSEIDLRL